MESINLHFIDYLAFAILLAILYGITAFEYYSVVNQKHLSDQNKLDLRKAASWTFFGILFTVIGGIISELDISIWTEYSPLVVPFTFLFIWADFHRQASKLIDLKMIEKEVYEYYEQRINKLFKNEPKNCFSIDKLYIELGLDGKFIDELYNIVFRNRPQFRLQITKTNIRELLSPFYPTKNNLEEILKEMDNIKFNKSDKCYRLKTAANSKS